MKAETKIAYCFCPRSDQIQCVYQPAKHNRKGNFYNAEILYGH